MTKADPPSHLVFENVIIPMANVSHILKPDATTHIFLKNGQDIRINLSDAEWEQLKKGLT